MKYEAVIGLEVHVQLRTRSKIFCACPTGFGSAPNSQTCPVCLGMPGVLPVLNKQAVDYALRMALALGCTVAGRSVFARKNYFYPDLPKGYQISQYELPLAEHGHLDVPVNGERRKIGITRIHMEDDAGKNLHAEKPEDEGYSFVDLNRTGVPLIEIVSEPDLRTPEEAAAYMRQIRQIVRYLGISDGNMQEGSLRCDANVSLRPVGRDEFGTKAELKNMNSFKHVAKALAYEIDRQTDLLDDGGEVVQETRLWDDAAGVTRSMRGKEEAHDYRYFPEPDLPVLEVDAYWLGDVRREMPELPLARRDRFESELGLSSESAGVLTESREVADFFEAVIETYGNPVKAANWIQSELLREIKQGEDDEAPIPILPADMAELLATIDKGTISGKMGKTVLSEMVASGKKPAAIIEEKGLSQITDRADIEKICREVVDANPKQVEQYRSGKDKVFGFFVGQVMKATKGQANPQAVNECLKQLLSNGS